MISYAQNFEDVILARVFKDQETGFYIDIGAWDAEIDSVTKHFYDHGWWGINVEPTTKNFEAISASRERDINLNIAVGKSKERQRFYDFTPEGLSTLDESLAESFKKKGYSCKEVDIDVLTLSDICEEYAPETIDFLKVDVEGLEGEVLRGADWSRFRPRVLIIEAITPLSNEPNWEKWEPFVLEQGYLFVYFDGLNRFYIRREEPGLAKHFALPPNLHDDFQISGIFALQEQNHVLWKQNNEFLETIYALQELNEELQKQHERTLSEKQSVINQTEKAQDRARQAEDQLQSVLASRSFRVGCAIRRIVHPAMPVLRPAARLARNGRTLIRRGRNRIRRTHHPVRSVKLSLLYKQALAPGQPFSFPAQGEEGGPMRQSGSGPLADIRALLEDNSVSPNATLDNLDQAIGALKHHDESLVYEAKLPTQTRKAILQAELISLLRSTDPKAGSADRSQSDDMERPEQAVIVDVRCLQDPDYRSRGIGHHARQTLQLVADLCGDQKELVLLTDPALPDLDPDITSLGTQIIASVDIHHTDSYAQFIELSPMTASPGPVIPFLQSPAVHSAAVVYDFIPGEFQSRYLDTDEKFICYRTQLEALARYDSYLAISEATAAALKRFTGRTGPVSITGVANPLEQSAPVSDDSDYQDLNLPFSRFVIVASGADSRKNLLAAIAAHAECSGVRRRELGLVVIGYFPAELKEKATDFAFDCGMGSNRLVFFTGLSDRRLQSLYERAEAVLVPSFAEGFSIPVVEAVASGTPVIASDIDVHRELLGDGWWLVPPDDPVTMGEQLTRALKDPGPLLEIQREALGIRFAAEKVASRMKAGLKFDDKRGEALNVVAEKNGFHPRAGNSKPRLAIFSPFPPQRSGVADYSEFTMRALTKYADITFFSDNRCHPQAASGIKVKPYSIKPFTDHEYDVVISVLGNSHFHIPILEYFREFGGACIAHDPRMTELYHFTRGPEKLAEMLSKHSDQPVLAESVRDLTFIHNLDQLPSIAYDEIAQHARPLIVHTSSLSRRIFDETGVEPVVLPYVPHHLPSMDTIEPDIVEEARRSLAMKDGTMHIATFGIVDRRTKASWVILDALTWLQEWGVNCKIHFIGPAPGDERDKLMLCAERLGITQSVHMSGWLPAERWGTYLLAADAAVQLRTFTHSPISGALLDCIAFGVPCVATESLAEEMQAPAYVSTVPDRFSGLLLAEELFKVQDNRMLRSTAIEPVRLQWLSQRTADVYARRLLEALDLGDAIT